MDPFWAYMQRKGGFSLPEPQAAMPPQERPAQPQPQQQAAQPQAQDTGLAGLFARAEQEFGLPQGYLERTAQIESNMNQYARNPRSSASGPFQFISSTAQQYGLRNPFDWQESTNAAARLAADNAAILRKTLGREPTAAELYLAHQQGGGGAAKLLSNPNARAVDIVGRQAVKLNGGNPNMTAGEFANLWIGKHSQGRTGNISTSGRVPQQAQTPFQPRYTKFDFELQGKARPNPPAPQVMNALDIAAASALGPGSRVVIYSGQENAGRQHGSNRHRTGLAADLRIYDPQGNLVRLNDPRAATFMRAAARAGIKGLGAGSEYMGDAFHMDMVPHENYSAGQDMAWGSMGNAMQDELAKLMQARRLGPQQAQPRGQDTVRGDMGTDMMGMQGQGFVAGQQPPGQRGQPQVNLPELPPQFRPRRSSQEIMGFLSQHGPRLNEMQRNYAMQQLQLAQQYEDPMGNLQLRRQYAEAIGWQPQRDPLANFLTDEQEQRLGLDPRGVYALDGNKVQVVQAPPQAQQQQLPAAVQEAMWYAQQMGLQPGTPEYSEFIRRQAEGGGQTININTGASGPELGKLSTDYGYVMDPATRQVQIDPQTGLPVAAPVPGSPAARELEQQQIAQQRAAQNQQQNTMTRANVVSDTTGRIRDIVQRNGLFDLPEVGVLGNMLSGINQESADVAGLMDTLKGMVAFDRLDKLRQASATGASGLGQVTEREIALLAAQLGALDQRLSAPLVLNTLDTIDSVFGKLSPEAQDYLTGATDNLPQTIGSQSARPAASGQNPFIGMSDAEFAKIDITTLTPEQIDQLFEARSQ